MRIKLPIIIHKPEMKKWKGHSFFIWVWVKNLDDKKLINHEKIHYHQQRELLFLPSWFVHGILYCWVFVNILFGKQFKYKRDTKCLTSYRNHPWELEAYDNDDNLDYLKQRKFLAWIKYFK